MNSYKKYASCILDVAIDQVLEYGVPDPLINGVKPGRRVEVPLRGKMKEATVLAVSDTASFANVHPISSLLSETDYLTEDLFKLITWIARYYFAPLHRIMRVMMPPSIRKEVAPKTQCCISRKGTKESLRTLCITLQEKQPQQACVLEVMLKVEKEILLTELLEKSGTTNSPVNTLVKKGFLEKTTVAINRSPLKDAEYFRSSPRTLNAPQQKAFDAIKETLNTSKFHTHLLFGVTGSGKTEVYLQAITEALKEGKSVLMLVPEISLTQQTIDRFRSRFSEPLAILHSRLSPGERRDAWYNIREGKTRIIIGARSALFSPAQNLGLIIIDEEHENAYKQSEEAPYYHARDVAVMRGKITNSTVILGTATPSLESYTNALEGKYHLHTLGERVNTAKLPTVKTVDMRQKPQTFSDDLLNAIQNRHEKGEQTILFLNRRGFHTSFLCKPCGKAVECPHCARALTFHKEKRLLACHLCGYHLSPPPKKCPACGSESEMRFRGVGTEQVEKTLLAIFPEIRTLRIDADTTRHKGSHERLFKQFGTGKADVLIGTQMVAKGLHFPQVTLVGILNSDGALNIPDFRASETVFQLVTQVAGRAGRGSIPGDVIIQTSMPENPTLQAAAKQDYLTFYHEEIAIRKLFGYPPFTRMAKISFTGTHESNTHTTAVSFENLLATRLPQGFELHPVVPCGHAKVQDRFRFQFLVRCPNIFVLNRILETLPKPKGVRFAVDIDPTSTYF